MRCVAMRLALLVLCIRPNCAAAARDEVRDIGADQALGLENYPAAIALHRKILVSHNDNALAHYHLGFAYGMTGRTTEEINEYLTAASLHLNSWDLFLNLGLAYLGENDSPKAIEALLTAVRLGPYHAESHFNLAIAYERSQRLDDVRAEITASLHLAPSDPEEHNTKAIICAESGDLACARYEWTELLQTVPTYEPARINLAILNNAHQLPEAASNPKAFNRNWFLSAR
jgi:Flp pilus assembly protein TadD